MTRMYWYIGTRYIGLIRRWIYWSICIIITTTLRTIRIDRWNVLPSMNIFDLRIWMNWKKEKEKKIYEEQRWNESLKKRMKSIFPLNFQVYRVKSHAEIIFFHISIWVGCSYNVISEKKKKKMKKASLDHRSPLYQELCLDFFHHFHCRQVHDCQYFCHLDLVNLRQLLCPGTVLFDWTDFDAFYCRVIVTLE